jgi:hypothetical protein
MTFIAADDTRLDKGGARRTSRVILCGRYLARTGPLPELHPAR